MNMRVLRFLPLSLLLSGMMYAMDAEKKAIDTEQGKIIVEVESTIMLPMPERAKGKNVPPMNGSSTTIAVQATGLGAGNWLSDTLWGEDKNVVYQIKNGTFDATNTANERRLERTIEKYAAPSAPTNLDSLHEVMTLCAKNQLAVDSKKVLTLARKFATDNRVAEEKFITEKSQTALKTSLDANSAILKTLREQVAQTLVALKTNDENLTRDLSAIFTTHQPVILKAVEIERATTKVNDYLGEHLKEKDDGFSTNPAHAYDTEFLKTHLGLTPVIQGNKDLNNLISDNIEEIKAMVELADKKSLTLQRKQSSSNEIGTL